MNNQMPIVGDNSIKLLSDNMKKEINKLDEANNTYYSLLSQKEEISYQILEQDTDLFSKKKELGDLVDFYNEKKKYHSYLEHGHNFFENQKLENLLINPICESKIEDDNFVFQLSNGIDIISPGGTSCFKFNNKDNPALIDNLNKLYQEDPEIAMLYLANNI